MLSKEEIEKAKRYFEDELHCEKRTYNCVNHYRQIIIDNHIVLYKYIQQLESNKQKLIEKLEKDIREETGYAKWTNSYTKEISPAVTKMISKSKYAQEILSILKGEKNDN